MAGVLKRAWEGWKRFGHRLAAVQTAILVFVFYFLVISVSSFVAFVLRRDLLKIGGEEQDSFWREKKQEEADVPLERYTHPF